ncbi:hypothetical protein JG688_00012600 [Phytophthora aleatoria]|uniref:Uncharacterized protein n=1 Tax=Phytophthora aleatoria TaxID=2496075 RepID=A0A8J5J2I9_9STRA|nr:hypothetical protein JG688_00012600 [Phytophthora aleatoria]
MVKPVGKILCSSEVTARDLSFNLDGRYFYIRRGGSTGGGKKAWITFGERKLR